MNTSEVKEVQCGMFRKDGTRCDKVGIPNVGSDYYACDECSEYLREWIWEALHGNN